MFENKETTLQNTNVNGREYSTCELSVETRSKKKVGETIDLLMGKVISPAAGQGFRLEENVLNYFRYVPMDERNGAPKFVSIIKELGSNMLNVRAYFEQEKQAEQFYKALQ